jgi:tryptophan synthase beta subunit
VVRAAIAEPPRVPGSVKGVARPDANGRFGAYGGKYVPETLITALAELETAYAELAGDKAFQARVLRVRACVAARVGGARERAKARLLARAHAARCSSRRRATPQALAR